MTNYDSIILQKQYDYETTFLILIKFFINNNFDIYFLLYHI